MPRIIGQNRIARTVIGKQRLTSPGGTSIIVPPGASYSYVFSGTQTAPILWSPPFGGRWKFVGWGPGVVPNSGGYIEITRVLSPSDVVSINVGVAFATDTIVTVKGKTATAGRAANGGFGGGASGGDVNLSGLNGSVTGAGVNGLPGPGTGGGRGGLGDGGGSGGIDGGNGAPAMLPFRGADGSGWNYGFGAPGPGAGAQQGALMGSPGLVLAVFQGP